MRKGIWLTALALCFSVPHASVAQQAPQSQAEAQKTAAASSAPAKADSLVEAARKARQAKKGTPSAPVVFTNENMPTSATAISVVGDAPASADSSASTRTVEAKDTKNEEKVWRQKFAVARSKLREDKDKLDVMKKYFNETDSLIMQQAMVAQEKRISTDQRAIDDLEEALRKAGGDAAWGR
jgi:hypothetical protein